MNGMPQPGATGVMPNGRPTPQQLLKILMQMDPEKRAETLNRNPQLRVFVQTMERQRAQMAPKPPVVNQKDPIEKLGDKKIIQVPGSIPLNRDLGGNIMTDPHEWSTRLEKNQLTPSLDLKLYEQMIAKDKKYQDWSKDNRKLDYNGQLIKRMMSEYSYYESVKLGRMKAIGKPESSNITNRMWGPGYSGYGNGSTGNKVELVYPTQSKMGDQGYSLPAGTRCKLIPIRLEFDIDRDNFKLNDTLIWDMNDNDDVMYDIVNQMVKDYRIPGNQELICKRIIESFREQINEFKSVPELDENSNIGDIRVPIILDITVANNQLNDKFEWGLGSSDDDIIDFANLLCDELALPSEFKTAVAHSMKEQCQLFIKSLFMVGYKWDGSAIVSEDIKEHVKIGGLDSKLVLRARSEISEYGANVQELNLDQFEKIIKERERELRRKKRTATRGRRGGFVLPDLGDMPSTFRTPMPNGTLPGGVDLGVEVDGYIEVLAGIEVPMRQQMERVKEMERRQLVSAQILEDKEKVKTWLRSVVDRRMRGESLGAGVRFSNGQVSIRFAWR